MVNKKGDIGGFKMKKTIGIITIILFFVVEFDSCAVNLANSFGSIKKVDGTPGMILGLFMLAAGIISLCSKIYRGRIIASILFYCAAGVIGYCNINSYSEIKIWMLLNAGFAAMLLINLIVKWSKYTFPDYEIILADNINNHKSHNKIIEADKESYIKNK